MGLTEVLTIIFVVMKLLGKIDWSWWLVLLPEIIGVALYVLIAVGQIVGFRKASKHMDKHFKDMF